MMYEDMQNVNSVNSGNSEDEEEERRMIRSVIAAFKYYQTHSVQRINKAEAYLNKLHSSHKEMLSKYRQHLHRLQDCVRANYHVVRKMINNSEDIFEEAERGNFTKIINETHEHPKINLRDIESPVEPFKSLKVQITLKQFARDWSREGEEERNQCYDPIIEEIDSHFNPSEMDVSNVKILVPGAGLGRLTYELAYRGYYCEGNEFSFFMLIASNFVLNKCATQDQYTIYPWIHQFVNNVYRSDQIAPVSFPDVSPFEAPPKGVFQMVAGDFLHVYVDPNVWDCVATCFFIDCANNVIEFIETIYRILKPGGIWVNLGPLLYHYSDVANEFSIEPTFEDLVHIIETVGFKILKSKTGIRTKYAQNPRSMQQSEYLSVFCVCQKPEVEHHQNGISHEKSDEDEEIVSNGVDQ